MKNIALTGTIASGKSTALNCLRQQGIASLSADDVVHELLARDKDTQDFLIHNFATCDRGELRKIIFSDPESRQHLEAFLHPKVWHALQQSLLQLKQQNTDLVVVEVPLLFEAGLEKHFDMTLAIVSQPATQVVRLLQRIGVTQELAQAMMQAQLPAAEKAKRAQHVIWNDTSLRDFEQSLATWLAEVKAKLL